MEHSAEQICGADFYQHLTRIIVPRPIAWVATISPGGVANVAPFSFFTGVGSRPPTLLFCPANRLNGQPKDTLRNIRDTGEFVVNVVPRRLAEAMNLTSTDLPEDESEFRRFDIGTAPSVAVRAPRVLGSPVCIECRREQILSLSDGPGGANIVIGRIVHLYVSDDVTGADGYADNERLDAIGRLGGPSYCTTRDRFDLQRPGT